MSDTQNKPNTETEPRDLSLEEMDQVTGGAPRNQEEADKRSGEQDRK